MTKIVKEVVDAQKQSDKMFLEMEEKRMKYEADQRKEEREFQLRMMSMLVGRQKEHTWHQIRLDLTDLFLVSQIHQTMIICSNHSYYKLTMKPCVVLCFNLRMYVYFR